MRALTLALLFVTIQAHAQFSGLDLSFPAFAYAAGAAAPPAGYTYLVEEDAEGTGTPSGWTDSVAPDWDHAVTVLEGSESLETYSNELTYKTFTAQSEVWAAFMVRFSDLSTSPYTPALRDSGDADCVRLRFMSAGDVRIYMNGGNSTISGGGIGGVAANTTYYAWVHYIKGTGANAEAHMYLSTTTTMPGSPSGSKTDGTNTNDADRITISAGNAVNLYSDHIRVTADTLTDWPE